MYEKGIHSGVAEYTIIPEIVDQTTKQLQINADLNEEELLESPAVKIHHIIIRSETQPFKIWVKTFCPRPNQD